MKQIKDDIDSIYWYSFFFIKKEFCRLPQDELRKLLYDRELFRYKYIVMAKLELFFRFIKFIEENRNVLYTFGDHETNIIIEYIFTFIKQMDYQFLSCFSSYEIQRIEYINSHTSLIAADYYNFQYSLKLLFFQIFYKNTAVSKFAICSNLMKHIFSFIEGDKKKNDLFDSVES